MGFSHTHGVVAAANEGVQTTEFVILADGDLSGGIVDGSGYNTADGTFFLENGGSFTSGDFYGTAPTFAFSIVNNAQEDGQYAFGGGGITEEPFDSLLMSGNLGFNLLLPGSEDPQWEWILAGNGLTVDPAWTYFMPGTGPGTYAPPFGEGETITFTFKG